MDSFIKQAAGACGWSTIAAVDGHSVAEYMTVRSGRGLGTAAINHRVRALKGFARWLVTNARLARDPLAGVKLLNAGADRRIERRALEDDELAALLDVAERSVSIAVPKPYRVARADGSKVLKTGWRHLRVPHRGALYLLAASTGFRSGELRSLTPRSFNLDAETPTVTFEAGYSKRRRRDVQPIRRDVAEALRPVIDACGSSERIWAKAPDNLAPVIASDLRQARWAYVRHATDRDDRRRRVAFLRESSFLATVDDAGRKIDFHALRHTFITRLARSGVTPTLARHGTITLTMNRYSHVALADTSKALDALPVLTAGGRRNQRTL